jgi:hypothetical protein
MIELKRVNVAGHVNIGDPQVEVSIDKTNVGGNVNIVNSASTLIYFSNLIADIESSAINDCNIIKELQEIKQAIANSGQITQDTNTKMSSFWTKYGSVIKDGVQTVSHLTTVLKYFGLTL